MKESELREFCEKNKGKKIRVVFQKEWTLEKWGLAGTENALAVRLGDKHSILSIWCDEISSLTVEPSP